MKNEISAESDISDRVLPREDKYYNNKLPE